MSIADDFEYTLTRRALRQIKAEAWQEGFEAGEHMARCWGHVDHWEGWPTNPHLTTADQADGEVSGE